MDHIIRAARRDDVPAIVVIYNYYVESDTCTFQTEPDTVERREEWLAGKGDRLPVLVAVANSEVVGWAALARYNERTWDSAWTSVYVRHDMRGRGIGRSLLTALVAEARGRGFHTLVAGINGEQEASHRLHLGLGFREVGRVREVSFKFGRWVDQRLLQLML